MKKFLRIFLVAANILCGLALIAGALGGYVDPRTMPHLSLFVLAFPVVVFCMLVILVCDYIWMRMWAVYAALVFMLAMPAVMDVFPANGPAQRMSPQEREKSFTFMTYNVLSFCNVHGEYPLNANPTLSEIIAAEPDIACLQETYAFDRMDRVQVSGAQLDSVYARYPYVVFDARAAMTVLSKFPVKKVEGDDTGAHREVAVYRAEIRGEEVTIFSVHLRSICLRGKERTRYGRTTLGKIAGASISRAEQADRLMELIQKYAPAGNVIVCGDFNDVPGCYTLRRLKDDGLHSVNAMVGHKYMPTYNAYRLLVNIDHIMYRGALRPVSITRGAVRNSDHYPVTATFLLEN